MTNGNKNNSFQTLKILGDKARFNIIMLLSSGPKCVCDIFEELQLKQSIVSHHLRALKENDLVEMDRDGKWIYYSLNKKKLAQLQKFIEKIISTKETRSRKC